MIFRSASVKSSATAIPLNSSLSLSILNFLKIAFLSFSLLKAIFKGRDFSACFFPIRPISNSDVVVTIRFFVLTVDQFDPASVKALFVFDQLTER